MIVRYWILEPDVLEFVLVLATTGVALGRWRRFLERRLDKWHVTLRRYRYHLEKRMVSLRTMILLYYIA